MLWLATGTVMITQYGITRKLQSYFAHAIILPATHAIIPKSHSNLITHTISLALLSPRLRAGDIL